VPSYLAALIEPRRQSVANPFFCELTAFVLSVQPMLRMKRVDNRSQGRCDVCPMLLFPPKLRATMLSGSKRAAARPLNLVPETGQACAPGYIKPDQQTHFN
jgi:hypothetical protein